MYFRGNNSRNNNSRNFRPATAAVPVRMMAVSMALLLVVGHGHGLVAAASRENDLPRPFPASGSVEASGALFSSRDIVNHSRATKKNSKSGKSSKKESKSGKSSKKKSKTSKSIKSEKKSHSEISSVTITAATGSDTLSDTYLLHDNNKTSKSIKSEKHIKSIKSIKSRSRSQKSSKSFKSIKIRNKDGVNAPSVKDIDPLVQQTAKDAAIPKSLLASWKSELALAACFVAASLAIHWIRMRKTGTANARKGGDASSGAYKPIGTSGEAEMTELGAEYGEGPSDDDDHQGAPSRGLRFQSAQ